MGRRFLINNMKRQKQSRLDLLEKKIDAITRVIDHLLKESSNTKTMSVGTYELLKYFPDFKEAEAQLIQAVAEKEVKNGVE